jgi:uroporphyrin-III C-methyltransferase
MSSLLDFNLPSETSQKKGRILLVGSGPGHPSLLTIATHTALTQWADLVLSDKLVPDTILSLIPKHVSLRIANKFPGNVEVAQIEMMEAAVEAANKGLTVVRVRCALTFRVFKNYKSFSSDIDLILCLAQTR